MVRGVVVSLVLIVSAGAAALGQSGAWRQLEGPYGGDIWGIFGGPGGTVLANRAASDIMRSTDDGVTWAPYGPGGRVLALVQTRAGTLIGFDPDSSRHLRAVAGDTAWREIPLGGFVGSGSIIETASGALLHSGALGIRRSVDDGVTWTRVGPLDTRFRFSARGVGPLLYAAEEGGGIFSSSDDGLTWSFAGSGPGGPVYPLVELSEGTLLAGNSVGVFLSTDTAATWSQLPGINSFALGAARLDARTAVVLTTGGAVIVGVDGAVTQLGGVPRGDLSSVYVTPSGAIVLGYHGHGLYRSTDRGATFSHVGFASVRDVNWLSEGPDGAIFATASGSALNPTAFTLFRSTDGGSTWTDQRLSNGAPMRIVHTRDSILVGLGDRSIFRSSDLGRTWTRQFRPEEFHKMVATADGALIGAGAAGIFRSIDDGVSWERVATTEFLYDLAVSPTGVLTALGTSLHVSNDGGITWRSQPLTAPLRQNGGNRGIALPRDGVMVLLNLEALPILARSTDDGATWDTSSFPCMATPAYLYDYHERGLFVASPCGVAVSRDAGATWSLDAPRPPGERYWMLLAHSNGTLYSAGWRGIHVIELPTSARETSRSIGPLDLSSNVRRERR